MKWFESWFDSKYYHILYQKRDYSEAALFIDNILTTFHPKKNTKFLDLGCGSGRHSIYLNEKGFNVDGFDLSKKSLEEAKKKENNTLKFYQKDMRTFKVNSKYDFVLNLFTSFGYFEDDNDNKNVFENIAKSLKSDGHLIIDFFNSEKVINQIKSHETKKINDIIFNIKKTHDENFIYKKISITDKKNKYNFTEKVRLISKQKFINYANGLNMDLIFTFGNYNLTKYNKKTSDRLILVFKKTI